MSTNGSITLSVDGSNRSATLPLLSGTAGPQVIDIRRLYSSLGLFTFDPGYGETASCESKITYIDGDAGVLMYRGYPIEQLAEKSDFIEVCYLLMNGDLPTAAQLEAFRSGVVYHTMVHEQICRFFDGFRRDAHPMAVMCGVVGALAAFYHDNIDINDPHAREIAAFRLIAKVPTIAAMAFKYALGQPFVYPKNAITNGPKGYARNFIHMLKSVPAEEYEVPDVLATAMDRILILHADHEQNASTSTVRLAGSTGANPFACIAAGIAALWGPAHGGANEAVLKMLAEIGHPKNVRAFIDEVKDKNSHTKLMGFGHRVYKNFDPRARIMKESCDEVLAALGVAHEPLLDIARELERIALTDEYFISRKLYPNVDFYSGIILKAMEIPTSMFTAIFAVARTVGWVSQWKEMVEDPAQRIGRPRQLYTGAPRRDYVPLAAR